jgi:hypothetical protein
MTCPVLREGATSLTKVPFRVGLYARVSTHDQQTIPLQTRAMREYAVRRGWTLVLQVRQIGFSASARQPLDREKPDENVACCGTPDNSFDAFIDNLASNHGPEDLRLAHLFR